MGRGQNGSSSCRRSTNHDLAGIAKLNHILLSTSRASDPILRGALASDKTLSVRAQRLWLEREAGPTGITAHELGH
jgi:hypothetical protein